MGKLILSNLCSLLSSVFDFLGIGCFFVSNKLDDASNDLIGRERFDFPAIVKKLNGDMHD